MSNEMLHIESSKLQEVCRGILKDELKDNKEEEAEEESKEEVKDNDANGWTPAEGSNFVFVGTGDAKWPTGKGESRRERDLKRRREEQS